MKEDWRRRHRQKPIARIAFCIREYRKNIG